MNEIPGWVIGALAMLSAARVVFVTIQRAVDYAVSRSPSVRDDARWARIRTNFYYLFASKLLEIIAGARLPGTADAKTEDPAQ